MSTHPPDEITIIEDLAAIFRVARGQRECDSRLELYTSLSELEKQAYVMGAPDPVLKRVAESRFLAGILREAVSPVRFQGTRGARRILTAAPDRRNSREPA